MKRVLLVLLIPILLCDAFKFISPIGRLAYTETPAELIRSSLAKEDLPEDMPDLGVYGNYVRLRKVKNEG